MTLLFTFLIAASTAMMPSLAAAEICCEMESAMSAMSSHCEDMNMEHEESDKDSNHNSCLATCCHFNAMAPQVELDKVEEGQIKIKIFSWINQSPKNHHNSVFRPPILG